MIKHLAILAIGIFVGWTANSIQNPANHAMCGNYTTKHSDWNGWLSVKDGVYRCFWLESRYPWRTRQGIVEVR